MESEKGNQTAGLISKLEDRGLSEKRASNGAFPSILYWLGLAAGSAGLFIAIHQLSARGILPNLMFGNFNDPPSHARLALFLVTLWAGIVISAMLPARYKRPAFLVIVAATTPILFSIKIILILVCYGAIIYTIINSGLRSAFKWTLVILVWAIMYFGYLGWLSPLVRRENLESFAIILFAIFFLKDIYYLFEKTTVFRDRPDPHPLRDFFIYFMASPFFFNPFHIKPISYVYLHDRFLDREQGKIWRDGLILFGQGIIYLLLHAHIFSLWYSWPGTGHATTPITSVYTTIPGYQMLLFCHYNVLRIFLGLAGNAYIIVGILRMFGFDIKADFYFPFFARNLLEHWRRWNIYNRDFVVALIFNPLTFTLGRKINRYLAYLIATMLTFLGGLGILVHLVTSTFYVGEARFMVGIMSRTLVLGIATTLNIWLVVWLGKKGRKKQLDGFWSKHKRIYFPITLLKIYGTFCLISSIYLMQAGVTNGLTLGEIGRMLLEIFI